MQTAYHMPAGFRVESGEAHFEVYRDRGKWFTSLVINGEPQVIGRRDTKEEAQEHAIELNVLLELLAEKKR